ATEATALECIRARGEGRTGPICGTRCDAIAQAFIRRTEHDPAFAALRVDFDRARCERFGVLIVARVEINESHLTECFRGIGILRDHLLIRGERRFALAAIAQGFRRSEQRDDLGIVYCLRRRRCRLYLWCWRIHWFGLDRVCSWRSSRHGS